MCDNSAPLPKCGHRTKVQRYSERCDVVVELLHHRRNKQINKVIYSTHDPVIAFKFNIFNYTN